MKKYVITGLMLGYLFTACNRGDVRDFIPGKYVRSVMNEYSEGADTLVITKVSGDSYTIIHRKRYQRISCGKRLPAKSKTETWLGIYDEKRQVLVETRKGKVISFDLSKNILLVGSSRYKKTR